MSSSIYHHVRSNSHESGVTFIELLVVIVIISIVAALALMQRPSANEQFKRQNAARELKVAFERARFDSVKRRAEGVLQASVTVTTNSYTLSTDVNPNATGLESVASDLSGANITIAGFTSMTLPVTVTFDRRGEASAVDGSGYVNPQFLVCNGTCPVTPTSSTANIVLVTPTGTVNLLAGNATPPTFANANVTSIPTTTGISNMVSLP
ncbi:MAG: prepilin-type N-terminal cleavage/methylation domain-containing protein [Blastocatellia bacterium]|nr:prepilin-type N-terminal cleavage/methylation domain-containing protein [Blastocatellia bacterium]